LPEPARVNTGMFSVRALYYSMRNKIIKAKLVWSAQKRIAAIEKILENQAIGYEGYCELIEECYSLIVSIRVPY
jgi:hypothetical protein